MGELVEGPAGVDIEWTSVANMDVPSGSANSAYINGLVRAHPLPVAVWRLNNLEITCKTLPA